MVKIFCDFCGADITKPDMHQDNDCYISLDGCTSMTYHLYLCRDCRDKFRDKLRPLIESMKRSVEEADT